MRNEVSKLMAEVALSRYVRQLEEGDVGRALRQLVDIGKRYAASTFTVSLFELFSTMIRTAGHPYLQAFRRLCSCCDWRYLSEIGKVAGFDKLAAEAGKLRRLEGNGENWFQLVDLRNDPEKVTGAIDQACGRGVRSFLLYASQPDPEQLHRICAAHVGTGFVLMAEDESLTDTLLDALSDLDGLLVASVHRGERFSAAGRLERHRRASLLCRRVSAVEVHAMLEKNALPAEDGLFMCYLPDADVPAEELARFDALVCRTRMHPTRPFLPVILPQDLQRVGDAVIRETAMIAAVLQVVLRLAKQNIKKILDE